MRTRLVVSFFICFLLQACSGASTTKTNGVSNTSGNDQAGCIALDTIGIDGAVEKFVWNEEDGIGFLIQDNSYLDFIKSSFTSRPVFAMQAADGRITYSTEDLMKEMWPKERIEDPVSVVAWRPYGFALQEDGSFFLPVGVAQYDEKGCRSVPMLGRYRGNLAEMTLDFENMFSAVELRLRKDSFALEPIKVKQVILQGNDGEILAGSIKVVASRQELPDSVCEERKVSPCVVLDCGSGVELTEESTSFYLPVLPVEFRRGYSLTVVTDRDSGNMFRIQCGGKFPVRLKKGSDIPCGGYDCSPGVSAIHDSRSQFPGLSFGTGVYRRDRRKREPGRSNTCRSGCDEDRLFEAGYRFLSRNRVFPAVGGVELLYEYDIDVGFDAESSFGKVGLFGKLS